MNEYNERNFKELSGSLLPTILTDKKFIDFIKKYLTVEGFIPSGDVTVESGTDIRVDTYSSDGGTRYVIHYEKSTAMSHTVTTSPGWLEYGTPIGPGDIDITAVIKKGSKDLTSVVWGDLIPPVSMDRASLSGLNTVTITGKNASFYGGESVRVASDGEYSDTATTNTLTATIQRRNRYFWGVTFSKDIEEAKEKLFDPEFFKSSVGNRPVNLDFDPGYNGNMFRCFILPETEASSLESQGRLVLLDSNIPTHDSNTLTGTISPNPVAPGYERDYRFVFSSAQVAVKSTLTTQ